MTSYTLQIDSLSYYRMTMLMKMSIISIFITCQLTSFSLWFRIPRTRSCRFLSRTRSRVPFTFFKAIVCVYYARHSSRVLWYQLTSYLCFIDSWHRWNPFSWSPTWLPPVIMWPGDVFTQTGSVCVFLFFAFHPVEPNTVNGKISRIACTNSFTKLTLRSIYQLMKFTCFRYL